MKKLRGRNKSIKGQLILKNVLMIFIVCSLFVAIAAMVGRHALIENSRTLLQSFATQVGEDISRVIDLEKSKIEVIAENPMLSDQNRSIEEKLQHLRQIVELEGYKKGAIIDLEGKCITTLNEEVNVSDKEYFKENLLGKSYFTEPYLSKADGGLQIAITAPIYGMNREIVGILFFSKDSEDFSKITNNIKFATTGSAYVIDSKGTNIINNDIEKVKNKVNRIEDAKTDSSYKELAQITEKMIAGETGVGQYKFDGSMKFLGYAPVEGTGWSVGVTANISDMTSSINTLLKMLVLIGGVVIILMVLLTYFIASKLAVRLKKLKGEVEEISTGNFEVKEISDKANDEITDIYNSLENTKKSIGNMIKVIKNSTSNLNQESNELSRISEVFIEGTSNINNSIEESSRGTESQAAELVEIGTILNNFDIKINESSNNIENINKKSLEISERANESVQDMDNLSRFMDVLNQSFISFAKEINEMKSAMEEINQITELINDISEQTNLLALNAAIEATRAGEAGRGFNVVAEEIRLLAEQSKNSATNINEMINQVITRTQSIATTSDKITLELVSGEKNVENSIESFEGILNNVSEVTSMIKVISSNFKNIISEKNEIIHKVEEVSAVSEEMVATSEEIVASTEEFVSSASEIKESTERLVELTSNMEEAVNKFRI